MYLSDGVSLYLYLAVVPVVNGGKKTRSAALMSSPPPPNPPSSAPGLVSNDIIVIVVVIVVINIYTELCHSEEEERPTAAHLLSSVGPASHAGPKTHLSSTFQIVQFM